MTFPVPNRQPRLKPAAPAGDPLLLPACSGEPGEAATLVGLAYELLDAHRDTEELARDLARDPAWQAHLAYLRALQRTGRTVLARVSLRGPA
jgi:hypothetical protein